MEAFEWGKGLDQVSTIIELALYTQHCHCQYPPRDFGCECGREPVPYPHEAWQVIQDAER